MVDTSTQTHCTSRQRALLLLQILLANEFYNIVTIESGDSETGEVANKKARAYAQLTMAGFCILSTGSLVRHLDLAACLRLMCVRLRLSAACAKGCSADVRRSSHMLIPRSPVLIPRPVVQLTIIFEAVTDPAKSREEHAATTGGRSDVHKPATVVV